MVENSNSENMWIFMLAGSTVKNMMMKMPEKALFRFDTVLDR